MGLGCTNPRNLDTEQFCRYCGVQLVLKDRYRPMQPIGQGGFGKTFLAVDGHIPSRPQCVIKQLCFSSSDRATFNKAVALFRQEAMRLDQLGRHPQIPTLLAHFEHDRQLYLVQELIEGLTLGNKLQQQGSYTEAQIWSLLQNLLPVLQFIHERQVIHRDIKPANIIHRQSDRLPVLIDFGIAKLFSHTQLLQTGTIIGSPEYMAPEQTRGKAHPTSDLYSLGVTCIHLLTGIPPLDMFDIVEDGWAWRDFVLPENPVSDRLSQILNRLLQGKISQRFQSAAEVLQAMQTKPPATKTLLPHSAKTQLISPHNITLLTAKTRLQSATHTQITSKDGINYTKLQEFLAKRKWKDADSETWNILCQSVNKLPGQYLYNSDINKLPCEDLQTIDQLWLKYSNGHFGFSVQSAIYRDVGDDYPSFCDRIGWPTHNPPDLDSAFNFINSSPVGHLPSRRWVGGYQWWRHAGTLAAKLEQCGGV